MFNLRNNFKFSLNLKMISAYDFDLNLILVINDYIFLRYIVKYFNVISHYFNWLSYDLIFVFQMIFIHKGIIVSKIEFATTMKMDSLNPTTMIMWLIGRCMWHRNPSSWVQILWRWDKMLGCYCNGFDIDCYHSGTQ